MAVPDPARPNPAARPGSPGSARHDSPGPQLPEPDRPELVPSAAASGQAPDLQVLERELDWIDKAFQALDEDRIEDAEDAVSRLRSKASRRGDAAPR